MTRPLKLHWASSKPNFGDRLSPLICERLAGRPVALAPVRRCEVVALGSILQRVPEGFLQRRLHIWGAGFIDEQAPRASRHHLHALRGRHTARCITNVPHDIVYGDPGLLAADLLRERPSAIRHQVAVIPHYKDRHSPALEKIVAMLPRDTVLVDVFDEPLEILRTIASSRLVLASAMHGLIAADSLGVPNAWLRLSDEVRGGDFKFRDYYSAFDLAPQPLPLDRPPDIGALVAGYERPGLERIQRDLRRAFPETAR